jgi:hypothetical protein
MYYSPSQKIIYKQELTSLPCTFLKVKQLQMPGSAHRLIYQSIGTFVIQKSLPHRIEIKLSADPDRNLC